MFDVVNYVGIKFEGLGNNPMTRNIELKLFICFQFRLICGYTQTS